MTPVDVIRINRLALDLLREERRKILTRHPARDYFVDNNSGWAGVCGVTMRTIAEAITTAHPGEASVIRIVVDELNGHVEEALTDFGRATRYSPTLRIALRVNDAWLAVAIRIVDCFENLLTAIEEKAAKAS